jgi:hypothetical protein
VTIESTRKQYIRYREKILRRFIVGLNYLGSAIIILVSCGSVEAQTSSKSNISKQDIMSGKNSKPEKTIQLVDIASIDADNPQAAIKNIALNKPHKTINCDVFIAGGGLGGVAAAIKIW